MLKNVASQKIGCQMVSATDGSAFTGSVTVYVTLDAGTQAVGSVGSGACTHEGNGYHTYAPAQAETNGDLAAFTFTGTGAIPATVQVYTLPATGVLAPATLGRTLVVDASGLADANVVKVGPTGSGTAQTARDIGASVLLSSGTGTGQISLSSGTVTTGAISNGAITAAAIATDAIDADALADNAITAATIASDAITAAKIADGAIDTATFASGCTIPRCTLTDTITTYTGNTVQTGDSYARIGAAGASLSAVPWNASWDAEVQSEVQDAIEANNLDHLVKSAVDTNWGTTVHTDSVLGHMTDAVSGAGNFTRLNSSLYTLGVASVAIEDDTNTIQTWTSSGDFTATMKASVNAEVDTALTDIHLDHLLAATYDPASKPGAADALLNELVESDSGVSRFTANALEQGPSGSGASAADIADAVWDELLSGHVIPGSAGAGLSAAQSAGDPWTTALPGAYAEGTAGHKLNRMLDLEEADEEFDRTSSPHCGVKKKRGTETELIRKELFDVDDNPVESQSTYVNAAREPE